MNDATTMTAVGYRHSLPIDEVASLEDIVLPVPAPGPRDLLVEVRAVSVNPVDTKVRMRAAPESGHKVLGYDATGVVRAVGADVTLFAAGDEVWYAGDITRSGTNAAVHLVDERLVGRKPSSLDFADAAALPLTAITAWEILFDAFRLTQRDEGAGDGRGDTLLIIGGAGGVGSILIQLARVLTNLTVVATASREDTVAWCRELGADHVIDHHGDLGAQLDALGLVVSHVAGLTATDQHFPAIVDLLRPRGQIAVIDDPGPLDIMSIKQKSLSFHGELMFTRSMFETDDMIRQHEVLDRVADLVDAGTVRTTVKRRLSPIDASTLREAHRIQESGKAIGKTVIAGWKT